MNDRTITALSEKIIRQCEPLAKTAEKIRELAKAEHVESEELVAKVGEKINGFSKDNGDRFHALVTICLADTVLDGVAKRIYELIAQKIAKEEKKEGE